MADGCRGVRRQRRVPAEHPGPEAGREDRAAAYGVERGQRREHERAGHVLEQRVVGERAAQESRHCEIDAMAKGGAQAAANKDNQEAHRCPSLSIQGNKKAAQGGFGADSHRQCSR